jgi:hypothetical protein
MFLLHNQQILPSPKRVHGIVACFPKSGSTYTVKTICKLTGVRSRMFCQGWYEEQNLYKPELLRYLSYDTVSRQHMPGTPGNVELLRKYDMRTVILVRNIYDVCASLYDHYQNESTIGGAAYFDAGFIDLTGEQKLDAIVDLVVPWYFKFYVSWWDTCKHDDSGIIWLRYEDMLADRKAYFSTVMDHFGLTYDDQKLTEVVNEAPTEGERFNKGVSGRGELVLSPDGKRRIQRYCRYYPTVDFSRIGLSAT